MTQITAELVKELRDKTGAAMMDCKKALVATNGDVKLAEVELQKSGKSKAAKRAGRVAAEGVVVLIADSELKNAIIVEVNSETDFVGRDSNFLAFSKAMAESVWDAKVNTLEAIAALPMKGQSATIEEARQALISQVGENVNIRRMVRSKSMSGNQTLGAYRHGERIAVIVEMEGGSPELAKDIAMHIAANRPLVVSPEDVSSELLAREKEIYEAQAANSGKPKEIIEKMVSGKLKAYVNDVSLIGQPFIKNPDQNVGQVLADANAKVLAFHRYEVGEGIEKVKEDFVQAVMQQVQGS